jgi:hypothetical protein
MYLIVYRTEKSTFKSDIAEGQKEKKNSVDQHRQTADSLALCMYIQYSSLHLQHGGEMVLNNRGWTLDTRWNHQNPQQVDNKV